MATIDQIAKRPTEYLWETGISQLSFGLIFFTVGCSILIWTLWVTPLGYKLVLQWLGVGCVYAVRWKLSVIKRRVVFPRGGYVEPRRPVWVYLWMGLCTLAVFFYPRSWVALDSRLTEPGLAILAAAACLESAWRRKSTPAVWFALYLACLAPLLWWLPVDNLPRSGVLFAAVGGPVAVAGAIRLRRFARANPIPTETSGE